MAIGQDAGSVGRWRVAGSGDLSPGQRRSVACDGTDVCVFNVEGEYVAWENACPHQGGPVCDGHVTGTLRWDDATDGPIWSEDPPVLVCPWHGIEFDLLRGSAFCGIRMQLRRWEVVDDGQSIWVLDRA